MTNAKLLISTAIVGLSVIASVTYLTVTDHAQAQGPISRAAEACVTNGSGSALQCDYKQGRQAGRA